METELTSRMDAGGLFQFQVSFQENEQELYAENWMSTIFSSKQQKLYNL